MTQDAISLTPNEYSALQADGLVVNGHALSALPVAADGDRDRRQHRRWTAPASIPRPSRCMTPAVRCSPQPAAAPGFTVSAADAGVNMALTETVGGQPGDQRVRAGGAAGTGAAGRHRHQRQRQFRRVRCGARGRRRSISTSTAVAAAPAHPGISGAGLRRRRSTRCRSTWTCTRRWCW